MQVVPLYLYVVKECLPSYLSLCSDEYIISMANWLSDYSEKIMKVKDKDGSICVQCCGKHCAMIFNYAHNELKVKLMSCLEKALGNELVFYNICLNLKREPEISSSDLVKKYDFMADTLSDKLVQAIKEIKSAGNEEQQLKGMTIANVYILALRCFVLNGEDSKSPLASKIVSAIKALRPIPLKFKSMIPSAELLRNMIQLHTELTTGLDFKEFYPYFRLCKQFIIQKKFLLVTALLVSEYCHLDPPVELQAEVSRQINKRSITMRSKNS